MQYLHWPLLGWNIEEPSTEDHIGNSNSMWKSHGCWIAAPPVSPAAEWVGTNELQRCAICPSLAIMIILSSLAWVLRVMLPENGVVRQRLRSLS